MKLTFLGATGTVTGSKYLLEYENMKILVDCGLFQGFKEHRLRNWEPLPISPREIDYIILTHAHLDHSGYIPKLVKDGFRGKIFATPATIDLCDILLPDSGYIQEEDARHANKYGYSRHKPALPLYTEKEAEAALEYFQEVPFGQNISIGPNDECHFIFNRVGHILGAASVTFKTPHSTLVFSGDLGRPNDPIMKPPVFLDSMDYLIIESTYGNRLHSKADPLDEIANVVNTTVKRGGSVIIPSFAVGRAQSLLFYLYQLREQNRISPNIPIYLDSPMSIDATKLFYQYRKEHRLSQTECLGACRVAKYIQTHEESEALNINHVPSIIISASGMATGGRILHHLKNYLPDRRNTVLLTGFQAEGTRGDRLLKGEKFLKIHGQQVSVNAHIESLSNTSAHADYEEILNWLGHIKAPPKHVFVTHGTSDSAQSLKQKIEDVYGWEAEVPVYLQSVN